MAFDWQYILQQFQQGFSQGQQQRIQATAAALSQTAQASNRTAASFLGISQQMAGMVKSAVGAGGVVWAFQQINKSMDNLSTGSLQLRNMSINLNIATREILQMRQTMERLGYTSQQSASMVGNFGSKVRELATFGRASELFKNLRAMGGEGFAQEMMRMAESDVPGLMKRLAELFQTEGPKVKAALSDWFGIDQSVIEQWQKAAARNIEIFQMDRQLAEKWTNDRVTMGIRVQNVWTRLNEELIRQFYLTAGESDKLGEHLEDVFSKKGVEAIREFGKWVRESLIPNLIWARDVAQTIKIPKIELTEEDKKFFEWLFSDKDNPKPFVIPLKFELLESGWIPDLLKWIESMDAAGKETGLGKLGRASRGERFDPKTGESLTDPITGLPTYDYKSWWERARPQDGSKTILPSGEAMSAPGGSTPSTPLGGNFQRMSFNPGESQFASFQAGIAQNALVDIETDSNRILGEIRDTLQGRLGASNRPTDVQRASVTTGEGGGGVGRIAPGGRFGGIHIPGGDGGGGGGGLPMGRLPGFGGGGGIGGPPGGLSLPPSSGGGGTPSVSGDPADPMRGGGLPSVGPRTDGGGQASMAGGSFAEKAPGIMANLQRDFGLTREQAAGVLGNLGAETGGFKHMQEFAPRGGRGGWGWAQWTGPRRRAFERWVAERGLDPRSDEANYGFLKHELETSERGTIARLKRAESAQESAVSFERSFERAGVKNYGARLRYTQRALNAARDVDVAAADDARRKMDEVAAQGRQQLGEANINVNVAAPRDTKVDAEASGVFKRIKTFRAPQGAKAASQAQEWQWQNTLTD